MSDKFMAKLAEYDKTIEERFLKMLERAIVDYVDKQQPKTTWEYSDRWKRITTSIKQKNKNQLITDLFSERLNSACIKYIKVMVENVENEYTVTFEESL